LKSNLGTANPQAGSEELLPVLLRREVL